MITVPNKKILDMLPNTPSDGEYALVQDEGKIYQYVDKWNPVAIAGEGLQVSLYDINKNIFSQLESMSDEGLRQVHAQVFKFLGETMVDADNDYWALICWERNYITIFHHNDLIRHNDDTEEISDAFMDIIESLGEVIDVSDNGNCALEIWIRDKKDTYCYLFFNYKAGVVEGIA